MGVSEWDLLGLRRLPAAWESGQPPREVRFQDLSRRVPREQIHRLDPSVRSGRCRVNPVGACINPSPLRDRSYAAIQAGCRQHGA